MIEIAAAVLSLVLVIGLVLFVRRRRRKNAAYPRPTLYEAQLAQYADLRGEVLEERHRANLAERQVCELNKALSASHASGTKESAREIKRLQGRLDRRAGEKEAKELRLDNARLSREVIELSEQRDDARRDLAGYREADTVVDL